MASTYTPLGVELMATGENAGTWGTKTNANLNLVSQLTGGFAQVSIAGGAGTTALDVDDGALTGTAQQRMIEFTGSITGNRIVTIPNDVETFYILRNSTSGAYTVQFKYATGSGSTFTFSATDKGDKILFASASPDATNPNILTLAIGTGISDVVDDTSPQLGGNLDTNDFNIAFDDAHGIIDENGNEQLIFQTTGSAVNQLEITNNSTGNNPIIAAAGGDTNIGIALTPKGTGEIVVGAGNLNYGGTAVTSTGAELNILDGVTSTTAELNILDGVTSTTAELNILDGVTATAAEINYSDLATLGTTAASKVLTADANNFTKITGAVANEEATLTDQSTIAWDVVASPVAKVTLAGNRTIAAPSGSTPIAGQFIAITVIQDGTGSRTLTWNATYEFTADTAPTLTTTASKADLFVFKYNGSKWLETGRNLNLTIS
jgi:hypothetical protein